MKKQEWSEGLNHLDPALVEEYVLQKESLKKKSEKKKKWRPIASVAACFALIISAVIAIPMLAKTVPIGQYSSDDPSQEQSEISLPDIPVWDDANYTAEEIASLFDGMNYDGVATNAYTKVYVPEGKYLSLNPLTDQKDLPLYRMNNLQFEEDEEAFREFLDEILPKLEASLGVSIPRYVIEKASFGRTRLSTQILEIGSLHLSASQTNSLHYISLYQSYGEPQEITLDGETVQIDQRLSDQEIAESVSLVKEKLFDIFGESFPDTKIIRRYDGYSGHGATTVYVYFYDKSAHPLNEFQTFPVSDQIRLEFDNHESFEGDSISDGILKFADIRYYRSHDTIEQKYSVIDTAERISLEEAEALLYNGYVFGGHVCKLCMAQQEEVSFECYDFVSIEYVFRTDYPQDSDVPNTGIPFYAFYKQIGTAENGNLIYAKTYVPAIPVSGYTEYFEKQKENHGKYTFPETEYEPYPG